MRRKVHIAKRWLAHAMKPMRLLVLLVVGLFLYACIVAEDHAGRQRHRLEGTWYAGGSPDKLCLILSTPQGLEVRNESGGRSVLVYDPPNSVRAVDWEGGLRGEIHNDRILWANGTW
jgi:hypothetical protein